MNQNKEFHSDVLKTFTIFQHKLGLLNTLFKEHRMIITSFLLNECNLDQDLLFAQSSDILDSIKDAEDEALWSIEAQIENLINMSVGTFILNQKNSDPKNAQNERLFTLKEIKLQNKKFSKLFSKKCRDIERNFKFEKNLNFEELENTTYVKPKEGEMFFATPKKNQPLPQAQILRYRLEEEFTNSKNSLIKIWQEDITKCADHLEESIKLSMIDLKMKKKLQEKAVTCGTVVLSSKLKLDNSTKNYTKDFKFDHILFKSLYQRILIDWLNLSIMWLNCIKKITSTEAENYSDKRYLIDRLDDLIAKLEGTVLLVFFIKNEKMNIISQLKIPKIGKIF